MPGKKLDAEKALFYAFLRENGLKKTYQKDLILDTFIANEGHMSVEEIYNLVKKKDQKVGIVTVFRTLKSLTACGIAREINLGDGLTRFEHRYRHPLHHHIICAKCHRVIEFLSPELERVWQEIVDSYEFTCLQQRFQVHGICRDCTQQRNRAGERKCDTGKVFARDALKMALAMQKEIIAFYRDAALHNQELGGRQAFEMLAVEEEAHERQLVAELQNLQRKEKGLEGAPGFLHFDPYELHQLVPNLQANLIEGELRLDARRVLELAMQFEHGAARFFSEYAEKFGETEGGRIFERFADMALRHHADIGRRTLAATST